MLPGGSAANKRQFCTQLSRNGGLDVYFKSGENWEKLCAKTYEDCTRLQLMVDGQLIVGSKQDLCSMCVPS